MAKISVLLVLGVCLALQLATAFPHQKPSTAIQEDDIKLKELQITDESKSTETDFRTLLRPVVSDILATLLDFPTLLIRETPTFLQDLLVELNALPEKNGYVQELILRLTLLLERIEKLDLDDDSISGRKEVILEEISKLYENFVDVAKSEDETSETDVVKKIFDKLHWDELALIDRSEYLIGQAVKTYTKVFEHFWNSLSEAQREELPDMSDWYEHFQAKNTIKEKYEAFIEFFQILQKYPSYE